MPHHSTRRKNKKRVPEVSDPLTPIIFDIPELPISVNDLFKPWRGKIVKNPDWEFFAYAIKEHKPKTFRKTLSGPLRIDFVFVFGKATSFSRSDADNRIKHAQDCLQICEIIKNDSHVHEVRAVKIKGPADRTIIKISRYKPEDSIIHDLQA